MGARPIEIILQALKLLLPALIPSWRFFDIIAPSPRIEFALLETAQETPVHWQEFRPRPDHLPLSSMIKRMLWNPRWNESLFLVSCAERLMAHPTTHSRTEIQNRIESDLKELGIDAAASPYLQFRLVFLDRMNGEIHRHVTYTPEAHRYSGNSTL